jgi:hypothetical protein
LVNIYAPSGEEKLHEREDFFNLELPHLLIDTQTRVIMGAIIVSSQKQMQQATSTSVVL